MVRLLAIQGSARFSNSCPNQYGKTRDLMKESLSGIDADVDVLDLNVRGDGRVVQPCKACYSTAGGFHCQFYCTCYGPGSAGEGLPDIMHDEKVYQRLERADGFVVFCPVNWYSVSSSLKAMFDRLVCADITITKEDAIQLYGEGNIKDRTKTKPAYESREYDHLLKRHLEGKWAAFICHGDLGADDWRRLPEPHSHKVSPEEGEIAKAKEAVMPLVQQCRYSGINVPDELVYGVEIPFGSYSKSNDTTKSNKNPKIPKEVYQGARDVVSRLVTSIKQAQDPMSLVVIVPQEPRLLVKAMVPPGKGWQPMPHSKKGGWKRSKPGGGWTYWYPDEAAKKVTKKKKPTKKKKKLMLAALKKKLKKKVVGTLVQEPIGTNYISTIKDFGFASLTKVSKQHWELFTPSIGKTSHLSNAEVRDLLETWKIDDEWVEKTESKWKKIPGVHKYLIPKKDLSLITLQAMPSDVAFTIDTETTLYRTDKDEWELERPKPGVGYDSTILDTEETLNYLNSINLKSLKFNIKHSQPGKGKKKPEPEPEPEEGLDLVDILTLRDEKAKKSRIKAMNAVEHFSSLVDKIESEIMPQFEGDVVETPETITGEELDILDAMTLFTNGHVATVRDPTKFDSSKSMIVDSNWRGTDIRPNKLSYKHAHKIATTLASAPLLSKKTLWRGMGLPLDVIDTLKVKKKFDFTAIASFSADRRAAEGFMNEKGSGRRILFELQKPIRGTNITTTSYYPDEHEVITSGLVNIVSTEEKMTSWGKSYIHVVCEHVGSAGTGIVKAMKWHPDITVPLKTQEAIHEALNENWHKAPRTDKKAKKSLILKAIPVTSHERFMTTIMSSKGKVQKVDEGHFGARRVDFDNGIRAVLKPKIHGTDKSRGVPKDTLQSREAAAYYLDRKILRFGVIPPTALTMYDGRPASMQVWVTGFWPTELMPYVFNRKRDDWKARVALFATRINVKELRKVVILDLIMNSSDRHARNCMFDTFGKKVWAIDNGFAFGPYLSHYYNVFHRFLFPNDLQLTDDERRMLENITLEELQKELGRYLKPSEIKMTYWRIQWLLEQSNLGYKALTQGNMDRNEFPSFADWFKERLRDAPRNKILAKVEEMGTTLTLTTGPASP